MQYLVTMTTHVPEGVSEEEVDDVRAREAAHSRELADRGHLLRLWRPPLQPGEWRTLGLFAADDGDRPRGGARLDAAADLAQRRRHSPVAAPERPAVADGPPRGAREFLTTFTLTVPDDSAPDARRGAGSRVTQRPEAGRPGLSRAAVDAARPGARARPLAGRQRGELQAVLAALPLGPWLEIETTRSPRHPNDPVG